MRVYIHIGVHKTASTLIQKSIQVNSRKIDGLHEIVRDRHPELKNHLRKYLNGIVDKTHVTEKLNQILAAGEKINSLLISDENLLGPPASVFIKRDQNKVFYPEAKHRILKLSEVFSDHELTYLLYTREQESLLPSLYLDGLKYFRYDLSMEEFIIKCLESNCRFDELLEAFDGQSLVFKKFEAIYRGGEDFLADFWEAVGVKVQLKLPQDERVNSAISSIEAEICRTIAQLSLSHADKLILRKWLRAMPELSNKGSKVVPSPSILSQIREEYQDDISYR